MAHNGQKKKKKQIKEEKRYTRIRRNKYITKQKAMNFRFVNGWYYLVFRHRWARSTEIPK